MRIKALFDQLDEDKRGFLDSDSLTRSLDKLARRNVIVGSTPNCKANSGQVQPLESSSRMYSRELVKVCATAKHARITFVEFEKFVSQKELELLQLFQEIDIDNDNAIHLADLIASVQSAGIDASENELQQFIDHIDKDNDGMIDFCEFRDYLLLLPHQATLQSILTFFQNMETSAPIDFNADAAGTIPEIITSSGIVTRLKYFLAGGLAGAISRTATAPLDRLRVLLQTRLSTPSYTINTSKTFSRISYYELMKVSFVRIYQDGGILSFFRGNGLNVIKIFPESAIKFYVFEYTKELLRQHYSTGQSGATNGNNNPGHDMLGLGGRFMAGGLAGLISQFVIYPLDTIKTRMMAQIDNASELHQKESNSRSHPQQQAKPTNGNQDMDRRANVRQSNIMQAARALWKEGQLRAFYRGCLPSLVGIVPYAGIDLAVFETLKKTYLKLSYNQQKQLSDEQPPGLSAPVILGFGVISGTCGAVLVYPLSLIRTRYLSTLLVHQYF